MQMLQKHQTTVTINKQESLLYLLHLCEGVTQRHTAQVERTTEVKMGKSHVNAADVPCHTK